MKQQSVNQSVSCQLGVCIQGVLSGWGHGAGIFMPIHRPLHSISLSLSLSLSLLLLYAVWISNNKWLLTVDGEFLFLSWQSAWIVSFLVRGSFKYSMGTDRIDKRTIRKCIWHRYQDSTLKICDTARRRIRPWKPTAKRWYYIWYSANILSTLWSVGEQ